MTRQLISLFLVSLIVKIQNKVNRTCKDYPTGHGTGREKKRGGKMIYQNGQD